MFKFNFIFINIFNKVYIFYYRDLEEYSILELV